MLKNLQLVTEVTRPFHLLGYRNFEYGPQLNIQKTQREHEREMKKDARVFYTEIEILRDLLAEDARNIREPVVGHAGKVREERWIHLLTAIIFQTQNGDGRDREKGGEDDTDRQIGSERSIAHGGRNAQELLRLEKE